MPVFQSQNPVELAYHLLNNQIIEIPTETVYGYAAMPKLENIKQIYTLKKRESAKALPLALPMSWVKKSLEDKANREFDLAFWQNSDLVNNWQNLVKLSQFWPGPLTIITPRKIVEQIYKLNDCIDLPVVSLSAIPSIALRVPQHELVQSVLQQTGPVVLTSANISGQIPKSVSSDALASTIIDLTCPMKILRQGKITADQVQKILQN